MNDEPGFSFAEFWGALPFGDLSRRQSQKGMLLDFLHMQWLVFLDQLFMLDSCGLMFGAGQIDNAAARMPINENIHFQLRLPPEESARRPV